MSPAVIIGCPRSGTGYTAAVIAAAGIACGHEQVFTTGGPGPWCQFACDASWLAVPFLPMEGVCAGHQLRDPAAVIRSLVGISWNPQYRLFAERHLPDLGRSRTRTEWAVRLWCGWVERCDRIADVTWQVEALTTDTDACRELGALVGLDQGVLAVAAREISSRTNTRDHHELPDFTSVPRALLDRLAELAVAHGYPAP